MTTYIEVDFGVEFVPAVAVVRRGEDEDGRLGAHKVQLENAGILRKKQNICLKKKRMLDKSIQYISHLPA